MRESSQTLAVRPLDSNLARHVAVFFFFAALSFAAVANYHPPDLWGTGIDAVDWDQRFCSAQFWWIRKCVLSGEWSQIASPPFFWPAEKSLAAVPHFIALGVLSVPFHFLPPIAAYRAVNILMMTLAGWGMWILVRRMTGSSAAGLLAGLLYALGPHSIYSLNRAHIMTPFAWPFLLLALELHRRRPKLLYAAAITALLILCFWIDWYIILFTGILVACWLFALAISISPRRFMVQFATIAAAALIAALSILPVHQIYSATNNQFYFHSDVAMRQRFLPWETMIPCGMTAMGRVLRAIGLPLPHDNPAYIGLTAFLLAGFSVWMLARKRKPRRILPILRKYPLATFAFILVCVGIILMAGPRIYIAGRDVYLPMAWIGWLVEGFKFNRWPWRYEVLAVFGLDILAAFGFAWLLGRLRIRLGARWCRCLAAGLIVLAVLDVVPLVRKEYVTMAVGPVLTRLRTRSNINALAEVPVPGANEVTAALLRVTLHEVPVHHGYTDIGYSECVNVEDFLNKWPAPISRAAMEFARLDALLVHRAFPDSQITDEFAHDWHTLDEDDQFVLVVPNGPAGPEVRAFLELVAAPPASPPLPIIFDSDALLQFWRDRIQIEGTHFRTGIDPVIALSFDPPLDPARYRKIVIRMRLDSGPASPERMQIFWRGPDFPDETERRSAVQPVFISKDWSEVVFDFTHDPRWAWSGPITTIRWDITTNSNYSGEIGSVRIE